MTGLFHSKEGINLKTLMVKYCEIIMNSKIGFSMISKLKQNNLKAIEEILTVAYVNIPKKTDLPK